MAVWGAVFLVTLAVVSVSNEPLQATFPELLTERSGSRILSGWEADDGQFPFQVSLRMVDPTGTVTTCGASVIDPVWVLTAAHCTAGRLTIVVRAGVVNLTRPIYISESTEYYNYPTYDNDQVTVVQPNDIGLLKLREPVVYSPRLQPIRLQSSKDKDVNYEGRRLVASGWGLTWTGGVSPENLNWVFLSGVSNQFCLDSYFGNSIIQDSTICAAYYNVTSQAVCIGDSGGPLTVVDVDGEISQIGVVSFVSGGGCHTEIPGGFVRPGHYHDWFYEVTGISFDWDPEAESEIETTTVGDSKETVVTVETGPTTAAGPDEE